MHSIKVLDKRVKKINSNEMLIWRNSIHKTVQLQRVVGCRRLSEVIRISTRSQRCLLVVDTSLAKFILSVELLPMRRLVSPVGCEVAFLVALGSLALQVSWNH